MKKFLSFLAVGSFFATVEEFLTIVVLRGDVPSYVFTLVVLFPTFLTMVYFSSRLLDRPLLRDPVRELAHFFLFGLVGLLIEWFLMGLSPWSNPVANPILMLIFQLGMFSFWATVAFAPRLFANPEELGRQTRKWIMRFYVPYFAGVYVVALSVPERMRFGTVVVLIVFGYLFLNMFYARYFLLSFSRNRSVCRAPRVTPLSIFKSQ